jgi:hypothetical protein
VTEQHLDQADVDVLFEQLGREAVLQVRGDTRLVIPATALLRARRASMNPPVWRISISPICERRRRGNLPHSFLLRE